MTEQSPEQQLVSRVEALQNKANELQNGVRLTGLHDQVSRLETLIGSLRDCIRQLREKGYVFGKDMEARADGYAEQWRGLRLQVVSEIDRQGPGLEYELRQLEGQLSSIQGSAYIGSAKPAIDRLEGALGTLESKVEAVQRNIKGLFEAVETETSGFKQELERINDMLDHFAAAAAAGSFRLLPTEGAVMAVKAAYSRDQKMDKDDAQGILYLTDQRLLFEQNQEIATKKVLFITTEKQKVQKLLLEVPLAMIDQVQASKKGLFGHEDHLALTLKSGAPVYQAWLHLDGQDCNEWQELIGRARSADFGGERVAVIDQAAVEKVKSAPTQCPNCGAPMNQVVLRGMDSIECDYCKHTIRL